MSSNRKNCEMQKSLWAAAFGKERVGNHYMYFIVFAKTESGAGRLESEVI